jgi:hypothetical protein
MTLGRLLTFDTSGKHPLHAGAQPLDDAGLVAFTPCGHWWVYSVHADAEQMHELARFTLGIACSFCLTAWLDATYVRACGTPTRVN